MEDKRSSDSLIVRAALRAVQDDAKFLKAFQEVEELDGRLKQHRAAKG